MIVIDIHKILEDHLNFGEPLPEGMTIVDTTSRYRQGRFWVLGPVDFNGAHKWGVVDKRDLPGQRPARKPDGFNEFWPTEVQAELHADMLNRDFPE